MTPSPTGTGADDSSRICTKAGAGPLTLAGTELDVRAAKALPSSDRVVNI